MKGWLDNFGKANNANESNVSMSEDFVGLGYNTKGRNYSPAWGGQFEQGGIIPIAQNGVSEYMQNKMQEKKDATIAKEYDLPEVVVSAPVMTKYNDPDKLTGYPQYIPKPGDNINSPGWDIAEFYKSWVSSPEYERRMKNTGYYDIKKQKFYDKNSKQDIYLNMFNQTLKPQREGRMGALEAVQEPGYITIEPVSYLGRPASLYTGNSIYIHPDHTKNPEIFETTLAHEIGHAIDSTTPYENELIRNSMLQDDAFYNQDQFYIGRNPITGNLISDPKSRIREGMATYVKSDPQEFKSDLNALRYLMFDKGIYDIRKGKEFTKEDLEKAKEVLKDNPLLERSLDAAGESGFIKLMNVIAKKDEELTPIAMNGASMPGSVGFTYARVAGAAPSKGKYAKKTMASAQTGKNNIKKDATNIDTGVANKIAGLELQQNPDYQYFKYLQSLPQLRQAPGRGEELMRKGLGYADVATDVMQMGNFIPHPIAQTISKIGNVAGTLIDALQAASDVYKGNYTSAGINAASAVLPSFLGANTFRRNTMNLRPGDPLYSLTQKAGKPYTLDLTKTDTRYLELFSKVKEMKDNSLLFNRALLGGLGAETAYDAGLIGPVKKEYGGEIPSAQNGQEMRFYQNGLDWKPKSMQNGGDEMYEGRLLPEVTVTPYDEQFPFYQSLSNEQKRYINDEGPIGRATRALATTGKRGQTAEDISTGVEDTYRFLAGFSGIPGTLRFSKDPINKLKGLERTLFNTAVSSSPFLPTTPYDPEDLQSTFDVLDATGMGSMMAAPLIKPAGVAARMAGKAVAPHMISMSNVANETLDAIKEVNRLKQFEKIATADVPVMEGIEKVKDIRNFGRDIYDLKSQVGSAKQGDINTFVERFTKLEESAKQLEAAGLKPYADDLNSISNRLNELKGYKHDEFIKKVKSLGADEDTIKLLDNDLDLSAQYARQLSQYNDEFVANEINTGTVLQRIQNNLSGTKYKSSSFSPRPTTVSTVNNLNPITGETIWTSVPTPLKKVDNKIYTDSGGWHMDQFYSYPFYKNVGDKIIDLYANTRLAKSQIIPNVENQFDAIELIPSISTNTYNVGSVLRQASRYIDETPDGLFIPANSLSGDSYPLSLQMMTRELKNNPDAQLRFLGFQKSNQLGFSDEMGNPKVLASELSQILKDLEKTTGQALPKPFVSKHPTWDDEAVVFPKFGVSKGNTNQIIDDYMKNSSIAEKVGVKRPVYEVSNIPSPSPNVWQNNILKNGGFVDSSKNSMQRFQGGGQLNFNSLTNEYELPEVVVEGKDERIKNAMSQGMANLYGHVGELMGAPQKEMMQLITGKEQTPSQAWGFQKPGGWLDSYSSFGKNAFNFGLDALGDPVNAIPGVGMVDDIGRLSLKGIGQNLGKGIDNIAISQAPSPQMMADNIAASTTPNASTVANQAQPRYAELVHPHMDLLQELKQKTIDRLDTPEGRRRLQYMINKNFGNNHEAWGKPVEGWGEFFLHGFKSGQLSGQKKLTPDDIIEDFRNLKFVKSNNVLIGPDNAYASRIAGDEGFYGPGSFPVMYMGENQIPGDILRIFDHEVGHHLQRVANPTNLDNRLSKLELKTQPRPYPDLPISEGQLEDIDVSNTSQKWAYSFYPSLDYFTKGTGGLEKLPFAAEVRQSLLRRGKIKNYYDEITPQMIEDHYDLYNKTGGNKSILRLYEIMEKTPKNFKILSETLNNLPAVTLPIAGGAAATISALQNQQPVQKQKNGGITKDNLGYWNPDNWGKPVEIGSNNITMEGVYEPLLGISDTGDTKLMQPGKNYKFKGKKVTEFPVAKLGINQLDAQPMKKLNQLLNFTNNPDKDNWLDKYN